MAVQLGGVVNGTPQYFELADAPSVDVPAGSSLTMGVWMKVDAFDGAASNYIYSHGAYGVSPSANWIIYHENGGPTAGRMELRLSTQGAGVWQADRQNDMLDGTWTLVLLEKSGGNTWKFFKAKPGEQPVQFFTVTSTFIPGDPASIMRIGCPSVPADDTIRDARLWRGGLWRFFIMGSTLTDAEKLQLAQGKDLITDLGKTPDLYLRMDTDTVTDASANARSVTKVGTPTTISNPTFLDASNPISITEPANRTVHQRRNGFCDVPIAGQTFLETRAVEARAINATTNVPATNWTPITSITKAGAFSGVLRVPQGGWYKTQVRRREDTSKVATSSNVWGVGDVIVLYGQSQMQHTWSNYVNDVTIPPLGSMMLPTVSGYWTPVTGKGAQAFLDAVIAKTGMPTAIIGAAIGGRTIAQLSKGGQHYTDLINMCKAVTNGPAAVFWHQGGDDVVAGTTRDAYLAALRKLLTDLRTDLSNPFRFGMAVLSNRTSGTDATIDAIRDAHYDFLYSDPDTVWLGTNPDMVLADAVHYNEPSQVKYGKRMSLAALKALSYQDYDARGPSIGEVTVAGTAVTINVNHDAGTDLGTFAGTLPPNELEILVSGTPVTPASWKIESNRVIATLSSAPAGVVKVRNAYGVMNTNTNMVRDNLSFRGEAGLPLQPTRDDVTARVLPAPVSKVTYFVELTATTTSNEVLMPLLDQSLESKLNAIANQDPKNLSAIDVAIEQFYAQNKNTVRMITVNQGSTLYAVFSSSGMRKPGSGRPILSGPASTGYMHFDEVLGKPIWFKGSTNTWVDATGTEV